MNQDSKKVKTRNFFFIFDIEIVKCLTTYVATSEDTHFGRDVWFVLSQYLNNKELKKRKKHIFFKVRKNKRFILKYHDAFSLHSLVHTG